MKQHKVFADPTVEPALEMEFKVNPEPNLGDQHNHHNTGEVCMDVGRELAALVCVSKSPAH